uniref:Ulp1 protease family, C-terminal catalytic domain containing protein n=1 Tax=Oryza sativa subsp. japonica TaxID=39947 RepID=Q7XD58_ORYSJ|nr:Ulp1 protease family, C-terminal catalytic domain containing protein [Oryza sativa Japonica Group]
MAPAAKRNLGKAPIVDDSDESDCDGELSRRELDDIIYEIFRKEVVKDVKKEILNRKSCSHAFRYAKVNYTFDFNFYIACCYDNKLKEAAKIDSSFTRFSTKYFCRVISALSPHQKTIIQGAGFQNLLEFNSNYVPNKFATWIAKHVDFKTSQIILRDKVISVTKQTVCDIFGLPSGGLEFGKDFEAGKEYILSMYGLSCLPSVRFFGDQFIKKEPLTNEKVITSFLIVALACFLCPNSSILPSTKYLTIFQDVNNLRNYDWSKFIYDWSMNYMKKFVKTNSLGGCLYMWAVVYLDNVEFGDNNVSNEIPRICVWKSDMIHAYSEFDKIDDDTFGLRPLRDFKSTCYFQPQPCDERRISFQQKLDCALQNMLPVYMKEKICSMFDSHCTSLHTIDDSSCGDLLISVLAMIGEASCNESDQNVVIEENVIENVGTSKADDDIGISSAGISALYFVNAFVLYAEVHVPNDNVLPHSPIHNAFHGNEDAFVSKSAVELNDSRQCDDDLNFVTPQVGNANHSKQSVDDLLDGSGIAAAAAAIHRVAKKFRSRFNDYGNVENIFNQSRPLFSLLDSEDDVSDYEHVFSVQNEDEGSENVSPSSTQPFISFQSLPETPDNDTCNTVINENPGTSAAHNSQNSNKRLFKDVTNSPDVVCLGENKICDSSKRMCVKAEQLYNSTNQLNKYIRGMSSSGGKLPIHGPRRVLVPARHASDPFVFSPRRRFTVSDQENRYYIAICRLSDSSKWQSYYAVDIDNVKAKFYSFGHSLKKNCIVSPYVISVFCRVLFQDSHPSKSKRNYFFLSIGAELINDISDKGLEKVKKSFEGATNARKLHLCDMLYFPILHLQHWFLFIVDLKDRMLVILDCVYHEGDDFYEPIMTQLINNLQTFWDKFECSPMNFSNFKLKFPSVLAHISSADSGIFVMKSMELWSPRVILQNEFSNDNISNIRVQYANRIFFHPSNKLLSTEVEDVVLNWFDPAKFPRVDTPGAA